MPIDSFNETPLLLCPEDPWILPVVFALLGACIGSFLNVVIYRVPRGMSVNEPKRSFCPTCKAPIPWYRNIPVLSWLLLRGRSACCHTRIPARYWVVEVSTAVLFAAIAWHYCAEEAPTLVLLCTWAALMLVLLCVDKELMVVLPGLAVAATVAGVLASVLSPWLVDASGQSLDAASGLLSSAIGAGGGFLLLKGIALMGRLMFGRRSKRFEEEQEWTLHQKGEDLELIIGGERHLWSELFMEEKNIMVLEQATLPAHGQEEAAELRFGIGSVTTAAGKTIPLEECESLDGRCRGMRTRQEAMGSGDAWLAMAIGALCGWQGVLFSLVAGCLLGILWAIVAKIGRGTPMPFGPGFIAGAYIWLFFGTPLLATYWELAGL